MADAVSALEYHQRTTHTPQNVRGAGGLDFSNKPTPFKRYTAVPHVSLPDDPSVPSLPALEAIASPGNIPDLSEGVDQFDRETLAGLCKYAAGVTKEHQIGNRTVAFRAAACTGALYHIDLYPVVGADVQGLDPGVYHYDPEHHALDVLRTGDYRGVLTAAAPDTPVEEAPVTFVTTSEWWRNAWKYGDRTFRHAFWDSGTVVANLLAVAKTQGRPASVVMGFVDGRIVDLLGVSPADEAPLELVPIGDGSSVPSAPAVDPINHQTEPLSPDPQTYPLIEAAWRAGMVQDREALQEWRGTARESTALGTVGPGDGDRSSLDPVDRETASGRPLDNTIIRRGSCREYDRLSISFRMLSTLLDRAVRGVPLDGRSAEAPPLRFTNCFLLVNGVEGLPAGVYQYHPGRADMERLQDGECRQTAGHLALDQTLGADAAANLYFMADIEAIADAIGDRGYRVAQFEAAVTAGRLYLATYAHRDLGGTGLTFYDDLVTEFLAPRGAGQAPMFLYTLGPPG